MADALVPDSLLNIVLHHEARATPEEVRRMAAELQSLRATPSPPVAAPATPVTDDEVRRMMNSVISGQAEEDTLLAFLQRLVPPRPVEIAAAQPQPQPAQPLKEADDGMPRM
jgi:hypothetical protein